MRHYEAGAVGASAVATHSARPATAVVHDSPDVRLVLFRIEPGQQVPPHTSGSTVILSVREGTGIVTGAEGERAVRAGDVVAYEPNEVHGMRAVDERFVVLATLAPRPGAR